MKWEKIYVSLVDYLLCNEKIVWLKVGLKWDIEILNIFVGYLLCLLFRVYFECLGWVKELCEIERVGVVKMFYIFCLNVFVLCDLIKFFVYLGSFFVGFNLFLNF